MSTNDPQKANEEQQALSRHHNLPLLPQPTEDEKDPLRWPRSLKLAAFFATAFVNFTANFAGSGLSVATPVLQMQFRKTPNQVNSLLTFNFLLLGIGNFFWVPLGVKYGKRASLLLSTLMLLGVLIWTANEPTFKGLIAARCLSGFASAAGESIVPGIVSDIFFLHEHAAMMSGYTILVSSATAFGPLLASFIVEYSPGGWTDYVWVCAALAGANTVAIFLIYPESNFNRPGESQTHFSTANAHIAQGENDKSVSVLRTENLSQHRVSVVKKNWTSIWRTFITVDHEVNIFEVFLRPVRLLFRPAILLAIYIYGTSLACQIIMIFSFPEFLMAPPYFFSNISVGLMQIPALIGLGLGCIAGGYIADIITAAVIHRQHGDIYPEQRLISLIPGCVIAPAGCILIAFSCSEKIHWVAIAFGFGMVSFGTVYAPNIVITYVVESFPKLAAECLVLINVFKNLVAFLFLFTAVDWISASGWMQVYMIMFMLVSLGMLLAVPFYYFRKKGREETSAQ